MRPTQPVFISFAAPDKLVLLVLGVYSPARFVVNALLLLEPAATS